MFDHIQQRHRGGNLILVRLCRHLRAGIKDKRESILSCRRHERRDLFLRRIFKQRNLFRSFRWSKVAQHRRELKLGKERAAGIEVRSLRFKRGQVKLKRHMAIDGDKLFGEQHGLAILLQRLAIAFALHLRRVLKHRFHIAELQNQFDASLITDSRRTGHVVHCVAAQRHHVDNFFRGNAEHFIYLFRIENQVVLLWIKDFHAAGD